MQKVSKKDATTEAQHLPNQAFRLKGLHFFSFAASAKKVLQMTLKWTLKYSKNLENCYQRPPKSDNENKHKNKHQQNPSKSVLGAKMGQNNLQKSLPPA